MHVSEHHVHHRTNLTEWLVFVRGHAKFAIVAESFDKCRILTCQVYIKDNMLWFSVDSDKVLAESDDNRYLTKNFRFTKVKSTNFTSFSLPEGFISFPQNCACIPFLLC